jgi:sugar phosphate isomerase/epimerase
MKRPLFGVAVSEEVLGDTAPVVFQGGLAGAIERAGDFGFDSVEIHIRNPLQIDENELQRAVDRTGVVIAAVGTGLENTLNGLSLTSPDAVLRGRTIDRFREHIDLAGRFNATVFVGLCRDSAPSSSDRPAYLDRLIDALRELAPYAEGRNATLSVEPITASMTNLLNSTDETLEFLESPGLESVLLLMDTHHMHFEDDDIRKTFERCRGRIAHIHISDSDRRYPGSGEIDYALVGESITAIGYTGSVSLEIEPFPDPETAAGKGLEWMRSVWEKG